MISPHSVRHMVLLSSVMAHRSSIATTEPFFITTFQTQSAWRLKHPFTEITSLSLSDSIVPIVVNVCSASSGVALSYSKTISLLFTDLFERTISSKALSVLLLLLKLSNLTGSLDVPY